MKRVVRYLKISILIAILSVVIIMLIYYADKYYFPKEPYYPKHHSLDRSEYNYRPAWEYNYGYDPDSYSGWGGGGWSGGGWGYNAEPRQRHSRPFYLVTANKAIDKNILLDNTNTVIRFRIDSELDKDATFIGYVGRSLYNLLLGSSRDLMVRMTCQGCANESTQIKTIKYDKEAGESTIAEFDIVPSLDSVKKLKSISPSLDFAVLNNGLEYDFVRFKFGVRQSDTKEKVSEARLVDPCQPKSVDPLSVYPNERGADLIIIVEPGKSGIEFKFIPVHPELNAALKRDVTRKDGSPQLFETGLELGDLGYLSGQTYARLKTLVEQSSTLKRAFPDVASLNAAAQIGFDLKARDESAKVLYELGVVYYDRLFHSVKDGNKLSQIMRIIEDFGSSHYRVRIQLQTKSIYFPWQLLHSPQQQHESIDLNEFWGFKYEIGVIPLADRLDCGRLPGLMPSRRLDRIVYTHYSSSKTTININDQGSDVSTLGNKFGEELQKLMPSTLVDVTSKEGFSDAIKTHKKDLAMLWSFTHAHSGDIFIDADNKTIAAREAAGSRLDFSPSQSISLLELASTTAEDVGGDYFFKRRPFVFLNGCETGTQGMLSTTSFSLPGTFLVKGARGVVVTESPVWPLFAYHFELYFARELSVGWDAGVAMLATRRYFLEEGKNPLGLMYTYYGNPAFRLVEGRGE